MGYTEQQAQIAALEEREEALRGWVQSLDAWVNYLEVTQRDAQQETETLVEMSEEVTDWQNETDVWADGIVQWQADVAAYMNNAQQPGVPAEWETWRRSADRRIANIQSNVSNNEANINGLHVWSDDVVSYLNSGQLAGVTQAGPSAEWETWRRNVDGRIDSLQEWSDRVTDYLNSGQQPRAANTDHILLDLIKAYQGDPFAIARLAGHVLTLGD